MGLQYARETVRGSVAQYMPGATTFWGSLRHYFDVNNSFVVKKLGVRRRPRVARALPTSVCSLLALNPVPFPRVQSLLFPFPKRQWKRMANGDAPAAPVSDDNAPDLYIPSMAFITYVLMTGLWKGMLSAFHPDVLVMSSSTALGTTAFEVFAIRMGVYTFAPDSTVGIVSCECAAAVRPLLPRPPIASHSHRPPPPLPAPARPPCAHGLQICFPRSQLHRWPRSGAHGLLCVVLLHGGRDDLLFLQITQARRRARGGHARAGGRGEELLARARRRGAPNNSLVVAGVVAMSWGGRGRGAGLCRGTI